MLSLPLINFRLIKLIMRKLDSAQLAVCCCHKDELTCSQAESILGSRCTWWLETAVGLLSMSCSSHCLLSLEVCTHRLKRLESRTSALALLLGILIESWSLGCGLFAAETSIQARLGLCGGPFNPVEYQGFHLESPVFYFREQESNGFETAC